MKTAANIVAATGGIAAWYKASEQAVYGMQTDESQQRIQDRVDSQI